MKAHQRWFLAAAILLLVPLVFAAYSRANRDRDDDATQLISASSLLAGLSAGAAFPFIDTTPNTIARAHIAITDATSTCAAKAAPPSNVKVLVGQAGVALVSVMD